ncbi:RNA polymerase subunit AC19 [Arachnomyces sp. PD_36]|nr:RNA polymerase subunit AC19 [Arachnomyces sp. PD_36]
MPASIHSDDQPMPDAAQTEPQDEELDMTPPEVEDPDDVRIHILPGGTDTATSFQIEKEDHTLGNALRYIIMKNPKVEFCGYTIPHPSETKMNLRIQTYDTTTAIEALEKGLDDLMDLCDVTTEKFKVARDEFNASKAQEV